MSAPPGAQSEPPPTTVSLAERVEQERHSSAEAVDAYVPKVPGRIDELASPAVDILRQIPSVADVQVLVSTPKPTHRIIQLRDWHYVPAELFALDVRQVTGRPLSDEAVVKLYQKHLLEVELVQIEQGVLLRCLVKHHGLRRVLAEGLTPQGMENYKEIVAALRDMHQQVAEMQRMRGKLKDDAADIDEMVRDHRRRLLEYGAAVQLEIAHEVEVLPLDDRDLLEGAKPVERDGKMTPDPARREARHDGQVKAAMKSGAVSFIILGGDYDLSASVRRLRGGTVEYIRVTARRCKGTVKPMSTPFGFAILLRP
jgi:hypothetical protein